MQPDVECAGGGKALRPGLGPAAFPPPPTTSNLAGFCPGGAVVKAGSPAGPQA